MMLDLARHYDQGPVQMGDIANRQNISIKYLEQLIIPLKKAHYIESVRGPKGGHLLAKDPARITIAEIVELLDGTGVTECVTDSSSCQRAEFCPTRLLWKEISEAVFDKLKTVTLADLVEKGKAMQDKDTNQRP